MYSEVFAEVFIQEQTVHELSQSYDRPLPAANVDKTDRCDPELNGMRPKWYGGIASKAEAAAVLSSGWEKGATKASTLRESLGVELPRAKSRRRRKVWGSEGASLNVDRALAGDWDNAYRSTVRELRDGQSTCVTLVAGWGGNCDRDDDELFWSGAAMLVLSDLIEESGQSVKLCAVAKGTIPTGQTIINSILVKDHGEPLRVDALAGVVCHAGIFRSFGFRAVCNSPWDVGMGLGSNASWAQVDRVTKDIPFLKDPGTIRLHDCYSREAAIVEITRVVDMLKGPSVAAE